MDIKQIYHLFEIGAKKNQEDYMWPLPGAATLNDNVFIVCDGVGGSENGEVASRIISESVGRALQNNTEALTSGKIMSLLQGAKNELVEYASENGLNPDMATTFTLLAFFDEKAIIAWCGDSRVYHIRNGKILFKTADHSLVNSLVKSGEITESEASIHPQKNIILRAIKADESPVEADFHLIDDIRIDDYFMLCTDGVLENISDIALTEIVEKNQHAGANLTEEFMNICFGNTRDNFSMYLLRMNTSEKKAGISRKAVSFVVFTLLLLSVSAFIYIKNFGSSSATRDSHPMLQEKYNTSQTLDPSEITAKGRKINGMVLKGTREEHIQEKVPGTMNKEDSKTISSQGDFVKPEDWMIQPDEADTVSER